MPSYLSRTGIRRRRVILRVDFNVPIASGRVLNDYDLLRELPTIEKLLAARNACVLLSHHSDDRQTLAPLAALLARRLKRPVVFLPNPFGPQARRRLARPRPGSVFLVENLRFWPGEKANSRAFARSLSKLGEVFIQDAFGELHRPYASVVGIPRFLPSLVGPLVRDELRTLDRFRRRPVRRPLVGIFGGAKIETKIPILRRFSRSADRVLVGGAIANTLLAARGFAVGRSRLETNVAGIAAVAASPRIMLPRDAVVARGRRREIVSITGIKSGDVICDIGPETIRRFRGVIRGARSVVWNGPLGLVEQKPYRGGTLAITRALAAKSPRVVVGGGDTVAFLAAVRLLKKFKHVSTGGGAMLAYLAGEKLPGLEALKRSRKKL